MAGTSPAMTAESTIPHMDMVPGRLSGGQKQRAWSAARGFFTPWFLYIVTTILPKWPAAFIRAKASVTWSKPKRRSITG